MKIAPADWPQLLSLVEQALDLPLQEREGWVSGLELSDDLRTALLGLLQQRHAIETDDFLASLPAVGDKVARPGQPAVGSLIGPWRLIREIGQGGMSTVWLAERADRQLNRRVALKLPHAGPGHDLLARRLLRERDILASLEHRHIARLYDVGVSDFGAPYLVMEHVEGDNLLNHANALCMSVSARLALFQQVLAAVAYSHEKHILHRDLKPSNILVDRAGDVKLLDFGIARALRDHAQADSTLTRDSGHLLTPDYAAPEQFKAAPLDEGCDIYSLGVILFELLTGERPYANSEGVALKGASLEQAILVGEPRKASAAWCRGRDSSAYGAAPRALRQALRGDLDVIISISLEKAPAQRYRSVKAFHEDIARHLDGRVIVGRPTGWLRRAGKFLMRRSKVLAASAVVLIAAGGGYLASQGWSSSGNKDEMWSTIGPKQSPGNCEFSEAGNTDSATASASVSCKTRPLDSFGGGRSFQMDDSYRGQRAVLRARVRVHLGHSAATALLWLRVDTPDGETFYLDNMQDRPLKSSDAWQLAEAEVVVPKNAQRLMGGMVLLGGPGNFEAKDITIERRAMSSPLTLHGVYMDPNHPETPPEIARQIRAAMAEQFGRLPSSAPSR